MSEDNMIQLSKDQIRENPVRLRDLDREDEQYLGIVESIRSKGFISTLTVMNKAAYRDEATGQDVPAHYELIDGLQRFNAGKDAGIDVFPCLVVTVKNENDLLSQQLMLNFHRKDTKPIEYTRQIQRMINNNPALTLAEISTQLGTNPQFVNARLRLLKLTEGIQKLVDEGKIPLANAKALANLPDHEQEAYLEQAMSQGSVEFTSAVNKRVKELRDAARAGRSPEDDKFSPTPRLKKTKDIQAEAVKPVALAKMISDSKLTDPIEVAKFTLNWVLSLDPVGVAVQEASYVERKRSGTAAAEKRAAERLIKKETAARAEREKYEKEHGHAPAEVAVSADDNDDDSDE